jgi:hypothetical protein
MANWSDQTKIEQLPKSDQHLISIWSASDQHLISLRFTLLLLSLKQQVSGHQWLGNRTIWRTGIDLPGLRLYNAIGAVVDIEIEIVAFLEQLNTELFASVTVVQVQRVEVALLEVSKRFLAEARSCWLSVCLRRQLEFRRIHTPAHWPFSRNPLCLAWGLRRIYWFPRTEIEN